MSLYACTPLRQFEPLQMIARFQRLVVVLLLAAPLGSWLTLLAMGRPLVACVGALLMVTGYALFLGAEFAVLFFVQTADVAPPVTPRLLLAAWWHEVTTSPRVFLWRQPFRSEAEPDWLPDQPSGQRGVLLVHGLVCNRGFWNPWLRALRARGIPFSAINLEPAFCSIDAYASQIDVAVMRLARATGLPVVLVGHSMGGLAVRAWWSQRGADARVHRVITIGSPHQGTWLARFGRGSNGSEMRLGSPWLVRLAATETAERRARYTCFFGHCDNIVFPAVAGTLPGAHNIHLPRTAHVQMAFHPEVFDEVCRWLR